MKLLSKAFNWFIEQRLPQLERLIQYPFETQELLFEQLIEKGKGTVFGKEFGFSTIRNIETFKKQVPTFTYEQIYPYIERTLKDEQNVLWPTPIKWFAKSSGTTNARSKFIPVSPEALKECHYKAGKDALTIYIKNYPHSQIFSGKSIGIGGSLYPNSFHPYSQTMYGDVSAVIMKNLPFWAQWSRTPSLAVALMNQWEEKIEKIAKITAEEDITCIAGVPTWTLLLLQKVLEIKNKKYIHEIWPTLELFIHGAVSFKPYESLFQTIISSGNINYLEVYNASEGFFAVQDQVHQKDMLLLLDHGVFYEFIPLDEIGKENPKTIGLEAVELDKTYALVINTNAGLWRYQIGDTIKFTSLHPFRIKITGRTKHFINAFGEEVVIENAETAITKACQCTGATIYNYTAGPIYIEKGKRGGHEWIIEFKTPPKGLEKFVAILDKTLQEVNADYEAKRYKDMALTKPVVHAVAEGTFYKWMKKRGRLGGQSKVPRLANNRKYLDDMLSMLQEKNISNYPNNLYSA